MHHKQEQALQASSIRLMVLDMWIMHSPWHKKGGLRLMQVASARWHTHYGCSTPVPPQLVKLLSLLPAALVHQYRPERLQRMHVTPVSSHS